MFCSKCGAQLADNAKFCPNCGTPVQASAPQGQAAQTAQQTIYQQPVQQPTYQQPTYRQPQEDPVKNVFSGMKIEAKPEFTLFGRQVSLKTGLIILGVLVVVCFLLNTLGS